MDKRNRDSGVFGTATRLGAAALVLAGSFLLGCAGSPDREAAGAEAPADTARPEAKAITFQNLPEFPHAFPSVKSLAALSRRGQGPWEWLWDETDLWKREAGSSAVFVRRAIRLWKGAETAGLPGLALSRGQSLVDSRVSSFSPSGLPLGEARPWAGSEASRVSLLPTDWPAGGVPGTILLQEALIEVTRDRGEASLYSALDGRTPCHRFVVQAAYPENSPLLSATVGLKAEPKLSSLGGMSLKGYMVKEAPWFPPEASSPPEDEAASGVGFSSVQNWDQAASILAAHLQEGSGATPEIRALGAGKAGDSKSLTKIAQRVSGEMRRLPRSQPGSVASLGRAADIHASGEADPNQANLVLGAALLAGGWDLSFLASRFYGEGPLLPELPSALAPTRLILELRISEETVYVDLSQGAEILKFPPRGLEGRLALRLEGSKGRLVTLPQASSEANRVTRVYDLFPSSTGKSELVISQKPGESAGGQLAEAFFETLAPGWTLSRWEDSASGESLLSGRGTIAASKGVLSPSLSAFPLPELPRKDLRGRKQALDLGPRLSLESVVRIHLPEAAKILRRPPEARLSFRQGEYESSCDVSFKMVSWRRVLTLEEPRIPVEDVPSYAAFLSQVENAEAERLEIQLP